MQNCHAWTWYDNLCHLKSFKGEVKEKIGAVSGPKSCRKYISNSDLLVYIVLIFPKGKG